MSSYQRELSERGIKTLRIFLPFESIQIEIMIYHAVFYLTYLQ